MNSEQETYSGEQEMDFNLYQFSAKKTATYPQERALEYLILGMCSEAGEVAGKYKKIIRDNNGVMTQEHKENLLSEIGDVLWYAAMACDELNTQLSAVARKNLDKLYSRKERGKISGSGDNR